MTCRFTKSFSHTFHAPREGRRKKAEVQREKRAAEACGGKQDRRSIADPGKAAEASGDKQACELVKPHAACWIQMAALN
ncbi:MAG: hypothetical protein LBU32_25285 [Clostridiales bacterium]|jgi:hypothetical protein|nr:hypothetical protein [Clostridiales bacterium]